MKYNRNKEVKRNLFHRRGEIIIYRKQDSNMKKSSLILLYIFCLLPLAAQRPPKHEVRAAWVTAVYGLDWPRTRATTPESIRKQQDELVEILDKLKAATFNTVLFPTRLPLP